MFSHLTNPRFWKARATVTLVIGTFWIWSGLTSLMADVKCQNHAIQPAEPVPSPRTA
jgi:hypothetical protein